MRMSNQYWLVKQEPSAYAWEDLVKEGGTAWTGVRNFQARNHLRAMKTGDWALFYHSGEIKAAVGLARITKTAFPDPTAQAGDWSAVELKPVKPLNTPVTLAQIKANPILQTMPLARQSRLSVSPVSQAQFRELLRLAQTQL
jgi:predicted RNA-binding protein with PUA-like domain